MLLIFSIYFFFVEGIAQNIKHKLIMVINEVQLFLRERLRKNHRSKELARSPSLQPLSWSVQLKYKVQGTDVQKISKSSNTKKREEYM